MSHKKRPLTSQTMCYGSPRENFSTRPYEVISSPFWTLAQVLASGPLTLPTNIPRPQSPALTCPRSSRTGFLPIANLRLTMHSGNGPSQTKALTMFTFAVFA